MKTVTHLARRYFGRDERVQIVIAKGGLPRRMPIPGFGSPPAEPHIRLNVRLGSCVDGSRLARVKLTVLQIGRVQSRVRPVDAA